MVHLSNTFDIDPPTDQHTSMDGKDIPGALQDPLQPLESSRTSLRQNQEAQ